MKTGFVRVGDVMKFELISSHLYQSLNGITAKAGAEGAGNAPGADERGGSGEWLPDVPKAVGWQAQQSRKEVDIIPNIVELQILLFERSNPSRGVYISSHGRAW